jgi:hypothetical protein
MENAHVTMDTSKSTGNARGVTITEMSMGRAVPTAQILVRSSTNGMMPPAKLTGLPTIARRTSIGIEGYAPN